MTAIDGNFMLEHNYIRKVTLQKSQNGLKYEKSIIQDQFFSYILLRVYMFTLFTTNFVHF